MIGLILVEGFILLNVAAAIALGRFEHGSVRAWWRS